MQCAQLEHTSSVTTSQVISSLTTNNNKTESSPPVLSSNGTPGRGGNTQHQQQTTTNNNKPRGIQQWLLKEQLRKEGWQTLGEAYSDVYNTYLGNQHSGTWKLVQLFEKARDSRTLPAAEKEKITQETGWECHPEYPNMIRKRKKLAS